jgi:hypothetical protein
MVSSHSAAGSWMDFIFPANDFIFSTDRVPLNGGESNPASGVG